MLDIRFLFAYALPMDSPRIPPLKNIGFQERPPAHDKLQGALLVAAALIAVIRLRGEEIRPTPRVKAVIHDAVVLAREILQELQRR